MFVIVQNVKKRLIVWAFAVVLILAIPAVMMVLGVEGWKWDASDLVIMGGVMFGLGLAYELVARRWEKAAYRVAFGVGLATAFLLFWVNGAVGIIGSEDNPANLMYGAVFVVGLIGSLMSRLKPRGMASTLFAVAIVQMLVPVAVLFIWPAQASWSEPGVLGVFAINAFFAVLFVVSAWLFRRSEAPSL